MQTDPTTPTAQPYTTPSDAAESFDVTPPAPKPAPTDANPYAFDTPFTLNVSNGVRFHLGTINVLEANRKTRFGDRDAAYELIQSTSDQDKINAKAQHSDAIVDIARLDRLIKWHRSQVYELVRDADTKLDFKPVLTPPLAVTDPAAAKKQAQEDEDSDEPGDVEGQLKLAGVVDDEHHDDDDDATLRPVGRIESQAESLPTGVNQHLTASVNELDINDGLKHKLIANEIATMADLFAMEDQEGGLQQQLCMRGGCNQNQASLIAKAFKTYRKAHQDAFIKQMREEAGEDAGAGIGHDTGGKGVGTAKHTRRGRGAAKAKAGA